MCFVSVPDEELAQYQTQEEAMRSQGPIIRSSAILGSIEGGCGTLHSVRSCSVFLKWKRALEDASYLASTGVYS